MKILTKRNRLAVCGAALGALALTVTLAEAQAPENRDLRSRTQTRVARLFESARKGIGELNLTDAQKTKLQGLRQEALPEARHIAADATLDHEEKLKALLDLHDKMKARAAQFLSPQQMQKGEALKKQGKSALIQTAMAFAGELDLTGEQGSAIRGIVAKSFKDGVQAELPPAGRDRYAAVAGRLQATSAKIRAVLNPEQQSKFDVICSAARMEAFKQIREMRRDGTGAFLGG